MGGAFGQDAVMQQDEQIGAQWWKGLGIKGQYFDLDETLSFFRSTALTSSDIVKALRKAEAALPKRTLFIKADYVVGQTDWSLMNVTNTLYFELRIPASLLPTTVSDGNSVPNSLPASDVFGQPTFEVKTSFPDQVGHFEVSDVQTSHQAMTRSNLIEVFVKYLSQPKSVLNYIATHGFTVRLDSRTKPDARVVKAKIRSGVTKSGLLIAEPDMTKKEIDDLHLPHVTAPSGGGNIICGATVGSFDTLPGNSPVDITYSMSEIVLKSYTPR